MLTRLVIQDVVLIDRLSLDLGRGLNLFTGETGAGKSILLDALGLALGARADASLIRAGADNAQVCAEFSFAPPTLRDVLEEQGLRVEDEIVLRRTLSRDGKNKAFLNDQPIGAALLRQVGESLLEVHGQFDTQGLLNPATHRDILDAFGGLGDLKRHTRAAFESWRDAQREAEALRETMERTRVEADFLRAALRELDELAPQEGEGDRLAERRTQLQNRDKILGALRSADEALSGEKGAAHSLVAAGKALARIADKMPEAAELLAKIDQATNDVSDLAVALARLTQSEANDEETLDKIEERLFALRAVGRKHNVLPDQLSELRDEFFGRLALLDERDDRASKISREVTETRALYVDLSAKLGEARAHAAIKLTQMVQDELPPLKLDRARFHIANDALDEPQWGPDGRDKISFLATTNPGAPPAPINKIASGGELSRFMLALKVVLAKSDPVPTLVFDEVDAGIGGATASAVGERLAKLAQDVQVLVVTHSPQVAALGDLHLRVEKREKSGKTTTSIAQLDDAARIEEIARMLAGTTTTDAARAAAMSLLADHQNAKKKATDKNVKGTKKPTPVKTEKKPARKKAKAS